jgi:RND family efflux transporter MFP subunit
MADQLSADLASLRIPRGGGGRATPAGRRRGWVLVLAAVGGLAIAGVAGWQRLVSAVRPLEVRTAEIRWMSPAAASVRLTASGYVVPQVISRVGAKVLGRVAEVRAREGAAVRAGDVLVRLDDAEPRAALGAAQARAAAAAARAQTARATLAETRQQLAREEALLAAQATPRSVVDDLRARVESLAAAVTAADAETAAATAAVAELEVFVGHATVVAPIDGVVLRRPPDLGELMGPETGATIELADFRSLMVECDVPEGRLALVQSDAPAEVVLDAFPTERIRGVVASIAPRVDRAKATVTVKVRLPDGPGRALPDMAARVGFLAEALAAETLREPPRLFVPAAALVAADGGRAVYRVDEGVARFTRVTVGATMDGGFEVAEGLREGQRVVLAPPGDLRDGQAVAERSGP